jgi:hypothetical protein
VTDVSLSQPVANVTPAAGQCPVFVAQLAYQQV